VSSVDAKLIEALFRALAAAQTGGVGRIACDASTVDGISSITILALPTWLADRLMPHIDLEVKKIGDIENRE